MGNLKSQVVAALLMVATATQAQGASFLDLSAPPLTDVDTYVGHMGLRGTAVDTGEANALFVSGGALRATYKTRSPLQFRGDFRWFTTSNTMAIDTYNFSILAAAHAFHETARGQVGVFAGALHTEQSIARKSSSRRMFYGGEAQFELTPETTLAGQLGYLNRRGGLDGRGRDSVTDGVFWQVSLHNQVAQRTRLNISFASILGGMDFDLKPADTVRANTLAIGLEQQLDGLDARAFVRFELTDYRRSSSAPALQDRRISIGFTRQFGGQSPTAPRAHVQRLAPLESWVAQTGGPLK